MYNLEASSKDQPDKTNSSPFFYNQSLGPFIGTTGSKAKQDSHPHREHLNWQLEGMLGILVSAGEKLVD